MDWAWEYSQAKGLAKFALVAVADKARGPECKAYAGLRFLEKRLGVTRPTVIAALRELHELGELETVAGEKGPFGASVFRLPKAQGHVRATPESVNGFDRSDRLEPDGIGKAALPIGADAEEIGEPALPIEARDAKRIGKSALPIAGGHDALIGQGALPPEAQIGKAAIPLHQKTHQEEIEISIPAARTAPAVETLPKKQTGRRAQDPKITAGLARFEEFYAAYPRHIAPERAKSAWEAAVKAGHDAQMIIDAAGRYARSRKGESKKWTPYPSNWLKDCRWADEDEPDAPGANGHQAYLETPGESPDYSSDWFDEDPR